ncbi:MULTISPECIES: hypothetical protein [Legionella]|uniref:Transmembrane protein n=1 Tax=Legionella cincinnatiensis TaxID=28085 RepID=A0A378KQ76_9GAMM|nr:hypothetical protein [Legionella cincinnatiensis]KTC88311.1 hypothetical protein Lcin_1468 [Legionella cincinnatiensis]STY00455.1 Uncharacterised protein [Legionella cincinnatiensis]HAT9877584.1 hypothetical protein [Legionella pneumophila subsp. pneumophila]
MKKISGIISLILINGSSSYLIYVYVLIACSTKMNNLLQVAYEPSGMQMFFYFISLPFFIVLAILSRIHCFYFDVKRGLSLWLFLIWILYFLFIEFIDQIVHFPNGNDLFYYGSLAISLGAFTLIGLTTHFQLKQLMSNSW